jgi:hypothetical protein
MPNQLIEELPGIGHNRAPLGEEIAELLAPLRLRQQELLRTAATVERINNPRDAGSVADLIKLIREHEREIDRIREEMKHPYLQACRLIEREFSAVTHPLALARGSGEAGLNGRLARWRRQQPHETPRAMHTDMAIVRDERSLEFRITDLNALVGWLAQGEWRGALEQAARTILGRYLRALGIEVAQNAQVPGVKIQLVKRQRVL